jgi:hypothetical protein
MSRVNAAATVVPIIRNSANVNTTNVLQGKNHCTFPSLRTSLCESSAKVREARDTLHYVPQSSLQRLRDGIGAADGVTTANNSAVSGSVPRHRRGWQQHQSEMGMMEA